MKNLHPNSKILFFIQSIISLLVVFIILYALRFRILTINEVSTPITSTPIPEGQPLYIIIGLITVIVLGWIISWLTYINYKYELTDRGFRKEYGIIWKHYVTIPYSRIQNIDINRGVFARMLGLSEIKIQTAGNSGQNNLSEGRLPGLGKDEAEILRDELIRRIDEPISKQGI